MNLSAKGGLLLAGLGAICGVQAGTLIFQNDRSGQVEITSQVQITGIARQQIEFSREKDKAAGFVIPADRVVRYYDENIKVRDGAIDDQSSDYEIRIDSLELPENTKRNAGLSFRYQVMRNQKPGQAEVIRAPYFFLTVLTEGADKEGKLVRRRQIFPAPGSPRLGLRKWSELKILEKLLDPERAKIAPGDLKSVGVPGEMLAGEELVIPLQGIAQRSIIAYYLTAWSKNDLADSKIWVDSGAKVESDWLTRDYR